MLPFVAPCGGITEFVATKAWGISHCSSGYATNYAFTF
jgi:hypothetical protein